MYGAIKHRQGVEEETKAKEYYRQLQERQELYSRGLPKDYIGTLGENPLLKHSFNMGQMHKKEFEFRQALEEFNECLSHPNATEEERVAASILIGNCYYMLFEMRNAEDYYEKARDLSTRVRDERARSLGRAAALGNMGLVHAYLRKLDEALEHYNEALDIYKEIGDDEGIAKCLNNIGTTYGDLGKPDEALEYYNEALAISRKIGYQQGIANQLTNIGFTYYDMNQGKLDEALEYLEDALEAYELLGAESLIERLLKYIKTIEEVKSERIQ